MGEGEKVGRGGVGGDLSGKERVKKSKKKAIGRI